MQTIADPKSSKREIIAASRALIAAEAQNQVDQHKVIDVRIQQRNAELDAIAADLGIETSIVIDAQAASGGGNTGTEILVSNRDRD